MAKKLDVRLSKLWTAMEKDIQRLEVFRTNRLEHIKEFAGANYSDNGSKDANPINLLSLYVRVILSHLIGSDPRVMASTFTRQLRPLANIFQEWGNRRLVRMKFKGVMETAVTDSLFLMGITRTAITAPAEARFGGYVQVAGEPSITNIDFEDICWDQSAKTWASCSYIGHRYCVRYDDVKDSPLFDRKQKLKIVPKATNELYNSTGDDRVGTLSRGVWSNSEEYEDFVELWEVYLPRVGKVITFDADGERETPLLIQDWVGPPCGPYQILGLGSVPGQLIPKAPIMDLIDMHRSTNLLWRKLDNQASRAKTVVLYQDADEMGRIKAAKDGETVQSSNPGNIQEVKMGGPTQEVAVWAMQNRDLFAKHAGNIDALAGLASQAGTATQEKLLYEGASGLVQSMSRGVHSFVDECMTALGWFWWNHPYMEMTSEYREPGLPEVSIPRKVSPIERFGIPFEEIDLSIDPYSLPAQTPQSKLQIIDKMVREVFIPGLPLFRQPGAAELLTKYVEMVAKLTNTPELMELMERLSGVQGPPEAPGHQPTQTPAPANTTRTYERVSRPGATDQGHDQVMQQLMAGGSPQGQGLEQLMGQVG